jgi:hypothetical protein
MGTNYLLPDAVDGLFSGDPPQPSTASATTRRLFREVEQASLWAGKPKMYDESRRYLAANFDELNPLRQNFDLEPTFPILSAFQVAKESSLHAGKKITLVGELHYITVAGTTDERSSAGRNLVYEAQIGVVGRDDPLVYCLFGAGGKRRLRAGMQIVAVGVPIAEGTVKLTNGHFAEGAYMAVAMIGPYLDPREVVNAALREARTEKRKG